MVDVRCVAIFSVLWYSCSAVIYHLKDTEYSRMPPLFSLDEYEPCLVEEGSIYCVLQLTLHAGPENQLMRVIHEYSEHTSKHYNYTNIDRGICVTKSCQKYISKLKTTEELSSTLEACLNDSLHREYGLSAKVSTLYYCDHHNELVHIDAWDWTVLALILALGILNCVGSIYDYYLSKTTTTKLENGNAYLLNFSVKRNWKQLTKTETSNPKLKDLQFIHGFRILFSLSSMLMHVMMSFATGFTRNPHDIEKTYEISPYYLLHNGMIIIQVFFFISGFLKSYDMQIDKEQRVLTIWDICKTMLRRLSRLVPSLAMTLALVTSWTRHVGSGPLWKVFVTGSLVADCRNYWWHHLLFINNYTAKGKFCLIQTWHLATEVQVFLVAVSVYLVSRRLLAALFLFAAFSPALHTLLHDLDAVFSKPQYFRTWDSPEFWLQHALGHNSLQSFIIGVFTAERLYSWHKKGGHLVKSRWVSVLQYASVCAVPLILYSGRVFYSDGARAGLAARAAYSAAVRVLLSCVYALGTTAFLTTNHTYIKMLFDWKYWVVPSRLSYGVFLLHMIFINMISGARNQLSFYSFSNVMFTTCIVVLVSYIVSIPLYLLVEAPFTALFKSFTKKRVLEASSHTTERTKDKLL